MKLISSWSFCHQNKKKNIIIIKSSCKHLSEKHTAKGFFAHTSGSSGFVQWSLKTKEYNHFLTKKQARDLEKIQSFCENQLDHFTKKIPLYSWSFSSPTHTRVSESRLNEWFYFHNSWSSSPATPPPPLSSHSKKIASSLPWTREYGCLLRENSHFRSK